MAGKPRDPWKNYGRMMDRPKRYQAVSAKLYLPDARWACGHQISCRGRCSPYLQGPVREVLDFEAQMKTAPCPACRAGEQGEERRGR